jgi:hypothetical protein
MAHTHKAVFFRGFCGTHLHAVAGLGDVYHVVEEAHVDGVRCLAFRHLVRRLLHLHLLAVGEGAAVVHHLHGELHGALRARAPLGLHDAPAVDGDRIQRVAARVALEECRLRGSNAPPVV